MQFRTVINIDNELDITHKDKLMMFGSCFTETIGQRLIEQKFDVSCNPLGILFNPASIKKNIETIVNKRYYKESDLIENNGVWNSLDFHSQFARLSAKEYVDNINARIEKSNVFLNQSDFVFVTLGTAWVYEHVGSHEIVANCHKIPPQNFVRNKLSVSECIETLNDLVKNVRSANPKVQFIFTVSPIRHWKDGAHGNQVSKSTLIVALEDVCSTNQGCHYFPSYEIVMDELRDYRFYSEDLLHPNEQALNYIWERFSEWCFPESTQQLNLKIEKILAAVHHRPFNEESISHIQFKLDTMKKIKVLQSEYPFLNFEEEEKNLMRKMTRN